MLYALSSLGNLARHLGPRSRKVLRYVGFAIVGVVTFVFAFQLTFPFDRVKDRLVEQLSEKYDVTIGDVDRGIIPGRMYFKAFSIRTRPTKAGDVATTFYMDQLEVDLGLFALLRGTVSVNLDAKIGQGHITGGVALSKDGTSIHLVGSDLPSSNLPVREALGLPMSGKVRFAFDLDLPNEKAKGTGKVGPNFTKADGAFDFACPSGCTVGDGKSKLKLTTNNARQQEFLDSSGGGIDFGKVNIDSLAARVEIKSGRLEITKFDTRSGDGELHVTFAMTLNQDIQSSQVTGCLRFHGSEALRRREPKTDAAISTTGAPLGPDNLFHIKLDGQLRMVRRTGVVCGPGTNTSMDNPGAPPRPNLTITPEAPPIPTPAMRPPSPGIVNMPPPVPQAANPPPAPQPMPPAAPPAGAPAAGSPPAAPAAEGPPPIVYPSTGSGMPQPAQGSGFAPQPVPPPGPPAPPPS